MNLDQLPGSNDFPRAPRRNWKIGNCDDCGLPKTLYVDGEQWLCFDCCQEKKDAAFLIKLGAIALVVVAVVLWIFRKKLFQ